jgi:acyl-CoA dehydrogenase
MASSETSDIIVETATRIFQDLADPQTVNRAKDAAWQASLWSALEEAGLPRTWVGENLGGVGAGLADGFAVLRVAGRFAAPVPLAETLLAGWLAGEAGLETPAGALTVAPTRWADTITLAADGTLSGTARAVPFLDAAGHVVVLAEGVAGPAVAIVATDAGRVTTAASLAGDGLATLTLERARPLASAAAPAGLDRARFMLMGATVRANQIAGALESVLEMTTRYAGERVAFEKPIAKFQAVQHNLARLAGETAVAVAAAGSAADTFASGMDDDTLMLEAAGAKVRVGEAAQEGAGIAHQVHGAIGFTKEHVLHRFTLRMLAWRDEFGNESDWAARLGRMIARRGPDELWPLVASR